MTLIDSPVGELTLASDGEALTLLHFGRTAAGTAREDAVLRRARTELEEYFAGDRRAFDVPRAPARHALPGGACGARCSTSPTARPRATARSPRASGDPAPPAPSALANGRNPIAIVVPCHRVIGADGALTGYGGGLERKRWLLAHEAATARW